LIQGVGKYDAWEIKFSFAKDKASAETAPAAEPVESSDPYAKPSKLTITRTAPSWHVDVDGGRNISLEAWSDGYGTYIKNPRERALEVKDTSSVEELETRAVMLLFTSLGMGKFEGFDWISKNNYLGIQTVKGRQCLVFKKDDMTAWIDAETRFPIYWNKGDQTREFIHLPPPNAPIGFPPDVLRRIQGLKQDRNANKKLPAMGMIRLENSSEVPA
jgi:hypothetical protein